MTEPDWFSPLPPDYAPRTEEGSLVIGLNPEDDPPELTPGKVPQTERDRKYWEVIKAWGSTY